MNAKELNNLLLKLGACAAAVQWAEGKSLKQAWKTSDRADWMLWLCGNMAGNKGWPTRKQVVLAACDCAETALRFVPKGEKRPAKAIKVARAWARGRATLTEVRAASAAALKKMANIVRKSLKVPAGK